MLEDSGDAALGEQENVAVSLGPHCATVGDIVNQVDLGRGGGGGKEREREREGGKYCIVGILGGGEFLWFLWLRGKHKMFTHETVPHSTGMWFSILQ